MAPDGRGCGTLHDLYTTARTGDAAATIEAWRRLDDEEVLEAAASDELEAAVEAGETEEVRVLAADVLFADGDEPTLTGPVARVIGTLLYVFGYLASFVLFLNADTREAVVNRLRWAYRAVGVRIQDSETVDGVERTTFRCPYRSLGADRWGQRHACHDVLDLVDDGYVDWLARHRDIDYRRPKGCAGSACCYSEVEDL